MACAIGSALGIVSVVNPVRCSLAAVALFLVNFSGVCHNSFGFIQAFLDLLPRHFLKALAIAVELSAAVLHVFHETFPVGQVSFMGFGFAQLLPGFFLVVTHNLRVAGDAGVQPAKLGAATFTPNW